ncbi:hypothetical protein Goarm_014339 [Gossypium armourianum]|uniref:Uncharacterized protein n=1 Tax=Gossypium armourianum TaxID=34283 RepID=A0A7J9J5X0_9ROSI|nr:hypothetical protein [Gossypium armourianum]
MRSMRESTREIWTILKNQHEENASIRTSNF